MPAAEYERSSPRERIEQGDAVVAGDGGEDRHPGQDCDEQGERGDPAARVTGNRTAVAVFAAGARQTKYPAIRRGRSP